jgi:dTDP-4-dehydrorhamnose 3,5-epimerase
MIIEKTKFEDVLVIKQNIFEDHRGTFTETFNIDQFKNLGINIHFVRDAVSASSRHVLRGVHYDHKTWKLIQCLHGKIYFVVVDMRKNSATYLHWESIILTDQNKYQVLVPPHFGNGHLVLSDHCIFHYKLSEYYYPANEKTLKWDDPKAGIFWPVKEPVLSQKDAAAPYL